MHFSFYTSINISAIKVKKYMESHPLFCYFQHRQSEVKCRRLRMCDSEAAMETAHKCYHQSTRMAKKAEVMLREKQKKPKNK